LGGAICSPTGGMALYEFEHMGDAVPGQPIEILRLQPVVVSHFNGVRPALGQLGYEPCFSAI
jgi:hypothetical protein